MYEKIFSYLLISSRSPPVLFPFSSRLPQVWFKESFSGILSPKPQSKDFLLQISVIDVYA